MSNAVATVAFLQGQAWAKAPDGSLRPLSVGSVLNDDEILVTAQGAQVQLDFGNGEPIAVNGGMEVAMSRDFNADTATSADEAALGDASVQEALTVLEQGGDLLEALEETAAGGSAGGGSDGTSSFVQLARVLEQTESQSFGYESGSSAATTPVEGEGGYINRAPLVTDQSLVGNEDEAISGQVVASDIEGDAITYALTLAPANGTLALDAATGQFTFTPNANYNGADSFVVTVTDSRGNAAATTISMNILPVNDAPTTGDVNLTTDEDTPVVGQVIAQDIEDDTLSYGVSSEPTNGTVALNPATGGFVYTPNANYNGSDSFVVTISDGNGGTATSVVSIGVTPVNDAPVSSDQSLVTDEDTPINGQVVASDIDGDTLGYNVSGQPANGTVTLNPATGSFVYTPNTNYNGSDSVVVTISDGNGGTTTSRINIGINPVNDAPLSSDQNLTTPEDTPLPGQVIATDVEGDVLAYALSGQPANGSVNLNPATGGFVYTPNANYNGSDSFVVTISDGNGGTTTSRINIGVTPVNDAPVSSNLNLTTPEDTPISSQISASDIDGDSLTFTVIGSPANGFVSLNPATGSFVYTPNANYNGSDSFTVSISDGNGGTTTSLVSIGVTPVNDGPTASHLNLTTDEDVPVNGAISANDPDGDSLSYSITGNPANGTVVLNPATGTFTYTPATGYNGSDSFVVTVSDGNGGVATSTVRIGVNARNEKPAAIDLNLTTAEDTAVNGAISASDPDSDPLSYSISGNPASGTVVLNPSTGTFVYTPNPNYSGSDSFVVTISDGKGGTTTSTVMITVTPDNNDVPVSSDISLTMDENTSVNGSISASDPDGDPLHYSVKGGNAHGTVILNPSTGNFIYTPNQDYSGSDSFIVTVRDDKGGSVDITVSIVVNPVNSGPTAVDDAVSVNQDSTVTVAVRTNDTDPENDSLTVTGVTQGVHGSVVIDAVTGNPIYTPNAGFSGSDSFTYTVSDSGGATSTATVNVTVIANAAPVAVADSITLFEGGVATSLDGGATSLLANDTDAEGNPLTAILVTGPAHGTLTFNADGTFSYIHDGSETTVDSFTYKVNDGSVDGNTVTVNINVIPVNEKPIAVDDFYTTAEDTPLVFNLSDWLMNDSDPDGDTIAAFSAGAVVNGTLSYVGGQLTFTPNAEYSGPASFKYSIHDGHGNTATATVNIMVTNVDDPSVLVADAVSANEDTAASGNVLSNDKDIDSSLQVVSFVINGSGYNAGDLVSVPGIGSLTLQASGVFTFMPEANYNGPVPQVTYTTNTGFSSTLDITIDPVNDAPVANNDSITTTQNVAVEITLSDLTANDTDIDGHSLTVFAAGAVTNGSLAYIGGKLHFIPANNYTGPASFTYSITDGHGGTSSATVNITVTAAPNVSPETTDVTVVGNEDTLITINLAGSDSDGTVVGYVIKSLPANGVLYTDATMATAIAVDDLVTGPVYFLPNANWNGNTGFSYATRDDVGSEDATPATVDITVNPAADAAVLGAGAGSVKEDTLAQSSATGTLTITDPDAGEASFKVQSGVAGTYGSFSVTSDGVWTYNINNSLPAVQQLKDGESRLEQFTVESVDGTSTTVIITVNGTNDGPAAVADAASVNQNATLTLTPAHLLANDTDLDGDTLVIDSVQGATNGSVSLVGGNAVFTPTPGYHGPASFTYTVSDGKGGSSTATVSVTVIQPNQLPDAINDPVTGGSAYSVAFGDASATDLWTSLDSKGQTVSIAGYRTTGASAALYIGTVDGNTNVLGINTSPRTPSDVPTQIEYDMASGKSESLVMNFNGNLNQASFGVSRLYPGENGGELGAWEAYHNGVVVASGTFRLTGTSDKGSFAINTGSTVFNSIKFTALQTNNGTGDGGDYFLTSFQGSGPALANSVFTVAEGGTKTIGPADANRLLANDTDADGDTLTITHINGVAITNGQTLALADGSSLTINTDGSFSFATNAAFNYLNAGQVGSSSFTYTVSDGKGGSDTATATMTVIGTGSGYSTTGTSGSDSIVGTSGADLIIGGAGNDTLLGGLGADTFKWNLADKGTAGSPATDQVLDFSREQGDVINLADLLQGESAGTLTNYLHFTYDAGANQTTLHISSSGGYSSGYSASLTDQVIVLNGLSVSGNDTAIINQLKTAGQLITD